MGVIIRQSIKGTIITYIGALLGFVTSMFLATKYLTPEEVGLTKLFLESGLLFSGVALLGATASAVRYFPQFKSEKSNDNGFFFYLVIIPFVGLCIVIPSILFFKEVICAYMEVNSPLFIKYYNWLIPLTCFLTYGAIFEIYPSLYSKIVIPRFIREVLIRLLLIILYLCYAFKYINITGFVAGFVIVYGIALFSFLYYSSRVGTISLKHNYSFINKRLKKDFLYYTGVIIIGSLGAGIVTKIDIIMISSEINLAATGVYTIAAFMATIIEIPSRSILAISSPIASEAIKNKDIDKVNSLFKNVSLHQLLAGIFIFILIWINIDRIYDIIPNGEEYRNGKWVLFFIGMAKIIDVTFSFGSSIIQSSKHYIWNLLFVLFLAVLTTFTNFYFIKLYGVVGSAIATSITYLVSYSLQQTILQFKIKVNPFSWSTLKIIVIAISLLLINEIIPSIANPYMDIILRSSIILSIGVPLIYFTRVSKEINKLLHQFVKLIKDKL